MTVASDRHWWFVYAQLPSGEMLVPGQTTGCPGPDAWGVCRSVEAGQAPGCAGATWRFGPEPSWRADVSEVSAMCPLVVLDPLGPLPTPLD